MDKKIMEPKLKASSSKKIFQNARMIIILVTKARIKTSELSLRHILRRNLTTQKPMIMMSLFSTSQLRHPRLLLSTICIPTGQKNHTMLSSNISAIIQNLGILYLTHFAVQVEQR